MRRFRLMRREDETGVSGTGAVAEGVQFEDGRAALRWRTALKSTAMYDSMADLEHIHGHGGKTVVEWLDPRPGYPDGDDLVGVCCQCLGGGVDDGPSEWCIGCGARGGVLMVPRWFANSIREKDRQRIAAAQHLQERLRGGV